MFKLSDFTGKQSHFLIELLLQKKGVSEVFIFLFQLGVLVSFKAEGIAKSVALVQKFFCSDLNAFSVNFLIVGKKREFERLHKRLCEFFRGRAGFFAIKTRAFGGGKIFIVFDVNGGGLGFVFGFVEDVLDFILKTLLARFNKS